MNRIYHLFYGVRRFKDISVESLEKKLGIPKEKIAGFENGAFTDIQFHEVISLCAAVGLHITIASCQIEKGT